MIKWQEEISKHPLNTTIKNISDALDLELVIDDPSLVIEHARFSKIILILKESMRNADPDIVPVDLLNQIQNQLNSHGVLNTVANLSNSKDANLLRELNNQINPALSYILQLKNLLSISNNNNEDRESATRSLESFLISIGKKHRELEKFVFKTKSELEVYSSATYEFTEKLKQLSDRFETDSKEKLASLTSQIERQAIAFDQSQSESRKEFLSTLSKIEEQAAARLKELISAKEAEADSLNEGVQNVLNEITKDAQEKHAKIRDIHGLVALDSVTGGHKSLADKELDSAIAWRRLTLLSIVLAGSWIAFSLFAMTPPAQLDHIFWLQLGKTVSLTALPLSFAVYASKQSVLHRINERKLRSFFLQVQAFDPFIESLPIETRHELKKSLSTRIFGDGESEAEKAVLLDGDFKSIDRFATLVESLRKVFQGSSPTRHPSCA